MTQVSLGPPSVMSCNKIRHHRQKERIGGM